MMYIYIDHCYSEVHIWAKVPFYYSMYSYIGYIYRERHTLVCRLVKAFEGAGSLKDNLHNYYLAQTVTIILYKITLNKVCPTIDL